MVGRTPTFGVFREILKNSATLEEGVSQIELGRRGRPTKEEQANKVGITNFVSPAKGGMTAAYTEARLRRDRPDLAARVGERLPNGKRFTANRAAIEAGFRKQPTPILRRNNRVYYQRLFHRLLLLRSQEQVCPVVRP
jgi:hypothetical protein